MEGCTGVVGSTAVVGIPEVAVVDTPEVGIPELRKLEIYSTWCM